MFRIVALSALAILALAGATLEGLIETFPPQFVQVNGILMILCTGVLVIWVFKYIFVDEKL